MTILSEPTQARTRHANEVKHVPLGGDLLPWADPYIAELCDANGAEPALASAARRNGGRYRLDHGVRPDHDRTLAVRNEAPPPLGETPFRNTASTRRDQRQERPVFNPKPLPK